jgi:glycosyltransferase involved in cell wall biosynthesis
LKLLIISHTAHYWDGDRVVGWGPTVREIDYLSTLFSGVTHIAPLYETLPPRNALPYQSSHVHLTPVKPAGGKKAWDKCGIFLAYPGYLRAFAKEKQKAHVLHVRCPANISLLALIYFSFVKHPHYRWVKYAGNWKPNESEAFSYRLQRWWLRNGYHHGIVTVNGTWTNQPDYIFSFPNPSLTIDEIEHNRSIANAKELLPPYRLLFVGRVESAKGVGRILQIAKLLQDGDVEFKLDIVGDGPERKDFERMAMDMGLSAFVEIHGWRSRIELSNFYRQAHFILLPATSSEGWPKVLSEGMAYGVVPLAGAISSIPEVLSRAGAGISLPSNDIMMFYLAILDYIRQPEKWQKASQAGVKAAIGFTYEHYLNAVQKLAQDVWGINLSNQQNKHLSIKENSEL